MATITEQERSERFEAQRQRIREQYLRPRRRALGLVGAGACTTRALVSSDIQQNRPVLPRICSSLR